MQASSCKRTGAIFVQINGLVIFTVLIYDK